MNDWEQRYQRGETGWDRGGASPMLLRWLEGEAIAPGRVLIPGCGRGHEVLELARRGFDVVAIDVAPSAVAYLKQELVTQGLSAEVHLMDLFELDPDEPFDAIYEQTCLCALDPEHWQRYEAKLQQWLKPGGKLHAMFMQTGSDGGPPFHCDVRAMRKLFIAERWQWQEEAPELVAHRNGRYELAFTLTRR